MKEPANRRASLGYIGNWYAFIYYSLKLLALGSAVNAESSLSAPF